MSFGFTRPPAPQRASTRPTFPTVLRSGSSIEFVYGTVVVPTTIHAAEFSDAEEVVPEGTRHALFYPMTQWKDEVRMRVKLVDPDTADVNYKWMVVFRAGDVPTRHVTFASTP